MLQMAYLMGSVPRPSGKVGPEPLETADPKPKITVLVKGLFLINLRVITSNMSLAFLKLQPKNAQIRYSWSQV